MSPDRNDVIPESAAANFPPRRLDRVPRSHNHHRSQSRHHHREESKTVGEYALHVLFTSFIAQAEEKINMCIAVPMDPEPQIELICGQGADPNFDKLIGALGHIAAQKPKPLIDSLMLWRKNKSDAASDARALLQQSRSGYPTPGQLPRRNTEPGQQPEGMTAVVSNASSSSGIQQTVAQAERSSTVSIYILCRVFVEVIGQSSLACITAETEDKLEHIIFLQLKIASSDQLAGSPLKLANWFLFSQLLGVMSVINFDSIAGRFVRDLEASQQELIGKGAQNREIEGRMELVLAGMKHVKLKIGPLDAWDKSCKFMIALGKLFSRSHGHRLKYAYCQALETLLLPVAASARSELNHSKWTEVISAISTKLASMFMKPRHWAVAFPMTATLLCVSSVESFSTQWLQLVLGLQSKLKDRYTRGLSLQAIARLLWTYLYRSPDSEVQSLRKLDEIVKLILPNGKKTYVSTDPAVAEPLLEIIRIIGFKHQQFCFRSIIFPLINAELFTGRDTKDLRIEQLEPEKMVIGIRGSLAVLSDLEKGEKGRPPFPQNFGVPQSSSLDRLPMSPGAGTAGQVPARKLSNADQERSSRPVNTAALSSVALEYYTRFCEILGKITIICDNTFGGQAVLDEKFSTQTRKTPIAETFNFGRKEETPSATDQKQNFYDLLFVAVQALPRCLSADIPFNHIINLLCTGTAHVQYSIADSSAQSLKAIARQMHAQQVAIGYARFIFNFDDKYSTMSEGGMLGNGHIENTLKLYVELLRIWIDEIKEKQKEKALAEAINSPNPEVEKRGAKLDQSGIWAYIDEVEAHGFFFMCSQLRRVRTFAITVLRLVTEFDSALKKENRRLIHTLERESLTVMGFDSEHLTVAERSRLQLHIRRSNPQGALVDFCSSDNPYDAPLWLKVFPSLMHVMYESVPFAVTLGRELVLNRVLQMYRTIASLAEPPRTAQYAADRYNDGARLRSGSNSLPEAMIEQWKLYLICACTTMTDKGGSTPQAQSPVQHARKGSKTYQQQAKITSARELFRYILPLLAVSMQSIREAVVASLGSINQGIYKALLEELQVGVNKCKDDARQRIHQRTASSPRRNKRTDYLRTEITQVYRLTAHFLRNPQIHADDWILNNLVDYTKDLKLFLMDHEVQLDWEFQALRRHYCGLMEELFEGINRTKSPSRWMTFETRKSSFALMEDWCGYSPNQPQIREREETMRQMIINQVQASERGPTASNMEKEKNSLRTAALSAMAALCGGPVSITTESRANLQFDIRRMLSWIDTIFCTESDKMHIIGRRALKNLIIHNKEYPWLLEHSISRCYMAETTKSLQSYFEVVTQVLLEHTDYQMPFWRLLAIGLYTLGSEQSEIRSKAAMILRALEERQSRSSKIQDFDISISDKTKAVYKLAQFEISKRLSKQHSELAFLIFSEFTIYFKSLHAADQRNMVAAILPWIQIIELQLDPNGGPTAQSYVLLANLFEITIKSSSALHNEVQALWQALATGGHAGNVQLVLDFIMSLCLDRREQNFVEYAKQIVVFLSSTPAGVKVVEFLLMQITPKAMIPNEKRDTLPPPPDASLMPYLAELSEALPIGAKQAGFSLGQLSLILLVDLMVSPVQLDVDSVTLLLQTVTVLWDFYNPLVQDQAREMLVHLMHELVVSKIEDSPRKKSIEDFVDSIRRQDPKVIWAYEDSNGKVDDQDNKVPSGMEYLSTEVVNNFEVTYPGIKEQWAKLSLTWATSCPVRHHACRSFQIFRCILTSLDQAMLADMLARLSNTVADEDAEIQTFSMEILTTLKTLITKLSAEKIMSLPQLFWTTCACLDTINEREFLEALSMLDELLDKIDFSDASTQKLLTDGQPPKWEGHFEGLQALIHKGLRSSTCLFQSLATIDRLVVLPGALIGDDSRLLFATLANFPVFLHQSEQEAISPESIATSSTLARLADTQACSSLSIVLQHYAASKYRSSDDLLAQLAAAIKESFFPDWDFRSLTFLMGLLTNSLPWFKVKTMRILCVFIPDIDMRKPEIASHGPDLISPLLRLLQTEFCMQALEVLDHIMTMAGTPMDKHHLRMSMTRSTSRAIRKEYERTQSLFGIPEESGWAIPMPARHAEMTRANVHAAFYMCQSTEDTNISPAETPEVEFHVDDFQYGYFSPPERADTMMSDEGRENTNIGDLVMKLDSLDDFFEDNPNSPMIEGRSSRTITEFNGDHLQSGAQLYDEQTLPILHQSLGHAASVSSFQNGFADQRPPGPTYMTRESSLNAMNPTAFQSSASAAVLKRPGMHARSVTSPSVPAANQGTNLTNLDFLSDDDEFSDTSPQLFSHNTSSLYNEEVFSDGDDERPAATSRGLYSPSNMSSMNGAMERARSGMRRLTGGRSRENERARDQVRVDGRRGLSQPPGKSPRVPRVPSAYLRSAQGGATSAPRSP